LDKNNFEYEFYETTGILDGFNHIKNLEKLNDYSALVIVGGDGTIHEVINGMMLRDDKEKIPIAILPNGSGNDMCRNFFLETIDKGLHYLKTGNSIKIDLCKILIDYDSEE
jgi:sphingosine kinase